MTFSLSARSLKNLDGVHTDLVHVVKTAIGTTPIDFAVTYGLRTMAEQEKLIAEGKSKTKNSRHLTGHAVDLVAYIDGLPSWDDHPKTSPYFKIAATMKEAAASLGVPIEWGFDLWKWDMPHFQLPWSSYPKT